MPTGVGRQLTARAAAALLLLPACVDDSAQPPVADAWEGSGGSGSSHVPAITDVSECEPADPSLARADADALFDYDHVPTFDFFMPQADWEQLQIDARDEEYVGADLCFEGRLVGRVGLRFKGSHGTLHECFDEQGEMICPRLSLKTKFSEYDLEQRFYGLKRLNFNAYRHDDSRMKEKLAYDLFRAMGIMAPRASWAVLRVNGELQGLYGMVEQVDGRFTADRWPGNPDGNLYKEVWPTETDPDDVLEGLKTNEEVADVSAFVAFAEAVTSVDATDLRSTLGSYLDLDYLARYMAVDDAIVSYDGITYFWTDGDSVGNHNFYFYEEAADRYTLVPWDLESGFWINPDHAAPHWTEIPDDCTLTYPYWSGLARAPGCDLVFRALVEDLGAWRAAGQELLDGPFSAAAMTAAIDRHTRFIENEARADPTPTVYDTFDGSVAGLRSSILGLRARLGQLMADAP